MLYPRTMLIPMVLCKLPLEAVVCGWKIGNISNSRKHVHKLLLFTPTMVEATRNRNFMEFLSTSFFVRDNYYNYSIL